MKVAIVTHVVRHNDGQGRVNHEIARAALNEGFEVTLIASHVAPDLAAHPAVNWVRVQPSRWWPTNLLRQQVFAAKSALWLRRHRREFDVLHVNGFITWARADVNTAHFVHGGWARSKYYPFGLTRGLWSAYQFVYTRANAVLERWAYRRTRVIAAVSRKVADEIRASGGHPVERLDVIYNGVDTQGFAAAHGDRAKFDLPPGAFLLLFVGDLRTPRKNLGTVLDAMKQLPEHVHLAVAGYLPGSPYPDRARALGIASRVHFLGLVREMPVLMRSVDAYVFPSRYEAMSLSLLEAMASGLPVVTARTAGGAEIITPECGIVLDDPDDAPALAGAIAQLAGDDAARRAMGDAAAALAGGFGWARMAAQYIALYRQLAGGTPAAARDERHERHEEAADCDEPAPLAPGPAFGHAKTP
ncbi:glycosyltransferase family 4 protein [Paraburkholderia caballeronis]|uniref:Glycosyltransferase involved in cell wall bisynthesis n=1 Tax=Paraburkholderia caballeronis TaxID=416943 RepID=A0A1H7S1X2_9BURK|nr:glycosyltransferase family 4 protein [Paraburkholderia caballeronis]PXW22829.1 glycosyltransferase involved in cell wall biosynthesis [Paraburkholderia caballeronis]PXW97214.1 glycosyltransferase involved in cell wall biosynthesis [Paraburkholderia caballeronis]RAJ93734.1 glycosyltransferase involved in cell wall biosynthesis [Paraburkholderia caballeronis]SED61422.1 Glycosyltransferase involved in cell wall bisynthesis [Paraburkholderia caballeronis]SEL66316.1 Glycosyltransferase involved 